jgi:hypothetical protein
MMNQLDKEKMNTTDGEHWLITKYSTVGAWPGTEPEFEDRFIESLSLDEASKIYDELVREVKTKREVAVTVTLTYRTPINNPACCARCHCKRLSKFYRPPHYFSKEQK